MSNKTKALAPNEGVSKYVFALLGRVSFHNIILNYHFPGRQEFNLSNEPYGDGRGHWFQGQKTGATLGHRRNIRIKNTPIGARLPGAEVHSATSYVSHITFLYLTHEGGIK